MAGRQSKISTKHLECPVCLDIYNDPRMLPCAHTLCRLCIDGMVHRSSMTCPICRANHAVLQDGSKFPCNLVVAGMIDSSCKECRSTEPEGKCVHCGLMLCHDCQVNHGTNTAATQSLDDLDKAVEEAEHALFDTELFHMSLAIETEINTEFGRLATALEERRLTLLAAAEGIMKKNLDARTSWKDELQMELTTSKSYFESATNIIRENRANPITDNDIMDIKTRCQEHITEIQRFIVTVPSVSKPYIKYDEDLSTGISSFGSMYLPGSNITEDPVEVQMDCYNVVLPEEVSTANISRPSVLRQRETSPAPVNATTVVSRNGSGRDESRPRVVGQKGSGSGQFRYPRDVAVCPVTRRVLVADPSNNRVQVFDDTFNHCMDITQDGQGNALQCPHAVAINSKGEIIVADYRTSNVLIYRARGVFCRLVPGPWRHPWGIAVDEKDNVYICDEGPFSITVINKADQPLRTFGRRGTKHWELSSTPWYITICKGQVVVSDSGGRIHQFTKTGSFIQQLDLGIVEVARGLTVDEFGDLVIVDYKGPVMVVRDNKVMRRFGEQGHEPWHLHNPCGVAVTTSGQIIVANWGNRNLLVYGR